MTLSKLARIRKNGTKAQVPAAVAQWKAQQAGVTSASLAMSGNATHGNWTK